MKKSLLLGMNNPLSDDPEFDLYPYPEGSAGWCLWKMLPEGTTRRQYLDMFDRRNLLRAREWDQRAARAAAQELLPELGGRRVVVLGSQVRAALGLPKAEPLVWYKMLTPRVGQKAAAFSYAALPHPSGRNMWYNAPTNREAVGKFLVEAAGMSFSMPRGEVG